MDHLAVLIAAVVPATAATTADLVSAPRDRERVVAKSKTPICNNIHVPRSLIYLFFTCMRLAVCSHAYTSSPFTSILDSLPFSLSQRFFLIFITNSCFGFSLLQSTSKIWSTYANRLSSCRREFVEPSQLAGESIRVPVVESNDDNVTLSCCQCEGRASCLCVLTRL